MEYNGRMEIYIDKAEKIKEDFEAAGDKFEGLNDIHKFMQRMASYFRYHNINLTCQQEEFIITFINIVDNTCIYPDKNYSYFSGDGKRI